MARLQLAAIGSTPMVFGQKETIYRAHAKEQFAPSALHEHIGRVRSARKALHLPKPGSLQLKTGFRRTVEYVCLGLHWDEIVNKYEDAISYEVVQNTVTPILQP